MRNGDMLVLSNDSVHDTRAKEVTVIHDEQQTAFSTPDATQKISLGLFCRITALIEATGAFEVLAAHVNGAE